MEQEEIKVNLSELARLILEERYLLRDKNNQVKESPEQLFERVAKHVAEAENKYSQGNPEIVRVKILNALKSLDFLPNSPTLMNAGTKNGQLSACFVIPIDDSLDSIFKAIHDAAIIQSRSGGVGFSFSKIRPKEDFVQGEKGVATGPISFLPLFDTATKCIIQERTRRGANMGILNIDHPDIEEFLDHNLCLHSLEHFNLSIGITNEFISAVKNNEDFDLVNPRTSKVERKILARDLYDRIINQAWETGEPGLIFLDHINERNPTPQLGNIDATNPCGETPLLPYESCILGSINLTNMVVDKKIDWERLSNTIQVAIRFLDNVIDVN